MILVLSCGHFCPKGHEQHLEMAAFYPKIAVGYTQIVTISTHNTAIVRREQCSGYARLLHLTTADAEPR